MEGINNKKRFTIRFVSNNNQELSFGDHNENSNDRAELTPLEGDRKILHIHDKKNNFIGMIVLPEDTLICNGWYPEERDEFVPVKDFKWK